MEKGLRSGDWVRSKRPILWARLSDGRIALAAGGNLIEARHSKNLINLIRALNSGARWPARSSLKILRHLHEAGAIVTA
jgi:hypothetical protein